MGGPGHYFMENAQSWRSGRSSEIAICSKMGSLASTALSADTPTPPQPSPEFCLFLQGPSVLPDRARVPRRGGPGSSLTPSLYVAQLLGLGGGSPCAHPEAEVPWGLHSTRNSAPPCGRHPFVSCSLSGCSPCACHAQDEVTGADVYRGCGGGTWAGPPVDRRAPGSC